VLDLACGTGLVSLGAKQKVGPQGTVTGVDVSHGMLKVAQRKAHRDKLEIVFVNHDITDIQALRGFLPKTSEGFDLITCASALVLLESPQRAIKDWATLLKPRGRLTMDVPTEDSMFEGSLFEAVSEKLGVPLPFDRAWVQGQEPLRDMVLNAGLKVERIWRCPNYDNAREYVDRESDQLFDKLSSNPMYARFGKPDLKAKAKVAFGEELKRRVGKDGKIRVDDCSYVVIGVKL